MNEPVKAPPTDYFFSEMGSGKLREMIAKSEKVDPKVAFAIRRSLEYLRNIWGYDAFIQELEYLGITHDWAVMITDELEKHRETL